MSRSPSPDSVHEPLLDFEEAVEHELWIRNHRWLPSGRSSMIDNARQFVADNVGLLLVLASQSFFSMMNVAVKKLNGIDPPVPTLQVVLVRMGVTYIFSLAYIFWMKIDDPILGPRGVRLLLVFRGVSGFIGLFSVYYSLQYLSLSDATVLTFLSPMCTAVAGALFLKENYRRSQALVGAVSLLGVVLIARPPFLFRRPTDTSDVIASGNEVTSTERMIAVGVALFGVLGATGAYTSIRAIGKRAHALHTMAYFSIICVVASTIGMIVTRMPLVIPSRLDWLALLLMIGIFGFISQVLLTLGLQREAAGRASMAVYSQIVFATIFQRIFFHTTPTWLSIIGTCLILSSALYVAMTKEMGKSRQSAIELDPDDCDHVEAALHATHAKVAHADILLDEELETRARRVG